MTVSVQRKWATAIAVLFPIASIVAAVVVPWDRFLPMNGVGRWWLYATAVLGGIGILLWPAKWFMRLIGFMIYVPLCFYFLAVLGLTLTCVVHGPGACP